MHIEPPKSRAWCAFAIVDLICPYALDPRLHRAPFLEYETYPQTIPGQYTRQALTTIQTLVNHGLNIYDVNQTSRRPTIANR